MNDQFSYEEFHKLKGFLDAWDWCIELGIPFHHITNDFVDDYIEEYDEELNYYQDY